MLQSFEKTPDSRYIYIEFRLILNYSHPRHLLRRNRQEIKYGVTS